MAMKADGRIKEMTSFEAVDKLYKIEVDKQNDISMGRGSVRVSH